MSPGALDLTKKADLKENNFAAYFFIFLRMLNFQIPYTIESAFFMGESSKFPKS